MLPEGYRFSLLVIEVLPELAASIAACTTISDSVSRADVASSSSSILGFLMRALAIATRCLKKIKDINNCETNQVVISGVALLLSTAQL